MSEVKRVERVEGLEFFHLTRGGVTQVETREALGFGEYRARLYLIEADGAILLGFDAIVSEDNLIKRVIYESN